MAAMMRRSVTSLVRTWPSTIIRRAAAKSIIGGFREGWTASLSCNGRAKARRCAARSPLQEQEANGTSRSRPAVAAPEALLYSRSPATRGGAYRNPAIAASQGHVAEWLRNGLQNHVFPARIQLSF